MNTYKNNANSEYMEYTVVKGDTLYNIAQNTGTTISELSDINMLTSTLIYPGQTLLVPRKTSGGTIMFDEYLVGPNETVEIIANKLNTTPMTLGVYNDFGKLLLEKNQVIKVPVTTKTYTIEKGDSVSSILKKTGLTAAELLELNAINWLKTGNKIIVSTK